MCFVTTRSHVEAEPPDVAAMKSWRAGRGDQVTECNPQEEADVVPRGAGQIPREQAVIK